MEDIPTSDEEWEFQLKDNEKTAPLGGHSITFPESPWKCKRFEKSRLAPAPAAGIPIVGGSHIQQRPKRLVADPPTSIMGTLPKPLGKSRAKPWDQPMLRGASEWILDHDVHELEMKCLYAEAKTLAPHL